MTSYAGLLREARPEIVLVITSILVLFSDLGERRRGAILPFRSFTATAVAAMGCLVSISQLTFGAGIGIHPLPLTNWIQVAILAITICVLFLNFRSTFTEHVGEFVFLILLATIGMMFLVAAHDLLTFFVSLELLSLSLYLLTAFNKRDPRSSEAALKYFLFGGMSAAFLLFGFSFLYGVSNSIHYDQIAASHHTPALHPFVVIGIICTIIGFGFKIAAAPFHFWAPDTYEGAPAPAAAFIASASKIASFAAFFFLFTEALPTAAGSAAWGHIISGWAPILALLAAASMLLGNLVAIRQTSLRRLLAYSAIAHTGYMLLAFVSTSPDAYAALLYYVITYSLATVGIFTIISLVEQADGSDALTNFDGLRHRSPVLAACLFIFILSLAGIPPLAGFFGKFYIFLAAVQTPGLLWLAILAIATSAIALFYYLKILRRVFVAKPAAHAGTLTEFSTPRALAILLALAVVILGCFPNFLLRWIQASG